MGSFGADLFPAKGTSGLVTDRDHLEVIPVGLILRDVLLDE
jgi:hypothetical protein